jgi:hypothetical protein
MHPTSSKISPKQPHQTTPKPAAHPATRQRRRHPDKPRTWSGERGTKNRNAGRHLEGLPKPIPIGGEHADANVAPTDTYHPADRVWVYRTGTWRAGIIERASARAATVIYRIGSSPGTGVDTMTAPYVLPRADADPHLDR